MNRLSRVALGLLIVSFLLAACQSRNGANPPPNEAGQVPATPVGTVRIAVSEMGIYHLPAALLESVGLELSALRPDNVNLTWQGVQIPFWIDPDEKALFFYGQRSDSRYTAASYYLLHWGQGAGLSMAEREIPAAADGVAAVSLSLLLDENLIYVSRAAPVVGEPWFWQRFAPGSSAEVRFELPQVAGGGGMLRVALWGATTDAQIDPDHRVAASLNGHHLGAIDWDGETATVGSLPLPAGVVQRGENQLTLTAPGDTGNLIDLSYLDWVEIEYSAPAALLEGALQLDGFSGDLQLPGMALLFDVTDPAAPQRLVFPADGAQIERPGDLVALAQDAGRAPLAVTLLQQTSWSAESHQADYIMIAPAALTEPLKALVDARAVQGLTVVVVPFEEIAGEFGGGAPTPLAIQAFLRHARGHWADPSPRFVLLVGEGSYDYRDYLDLMPANVVPPLLVTVAHGGETVSDTRLGDVDGDGRPELAVGRWPVSSAEAVADLVRRTLAYEAAAPPPAGALFVADGSDSTFGGMSDRLIASAGLASTAQRLYGAAGEETIAAWNRGVWLVNYVGHGSLNLWGKDEMLSRNTLAQLSGSTFPPVVTQFTCLTGLFAHPEQPSLGEEMLWLENGPVAVLAATSLTLSTDQEVLAAAFLAALTDPTVKTVGEALLKAQQAPGLDHAGGQEIIDTFTLLGDPALVIVRPG